MPKVTIYIPTFNNGRFLDESIQSVFNQTFKDWELIIINDGSTDNTTNILKKYKNIDNVRIIEQKRKGLNVSNNIALRLSNGHYIIRLDGDDYFHKDIIKTLSIFLDNNHSYGLVYPDYFQIDEDGNIITIVKRKKIGSEVELLDLPAHGACTMIRKKCLINLDGYSEDYTCQDGYDLWIRFIQIYKPFNINSPLFYYRKHGESLTANKEKIIKTRRKIKKDFIDKHNDGHRPIVLGIIPIYQNSIYLQILIKNQYYLAKNL